VKNKSSPAPLRAIATVVVLAAAIASVMMVIHAGRHNRSFLLPTLFVLWVLSPFAGLLIIDRMAKPWSTLTRPAIYWLMLIISLGCLIGYSGLLSPPGAKAAFIFLIAPLLSWFLIVAGIPIAVSVSRRKQNRNSHPL
jgi:peptidoglycan/LPS O-acetylase OafA/YrhL